MSMGSLIHFLQSLSQVPQSQQLPGIPSAASGAGLFRRVEEAFVASLLPSHVGENKAEARQPATQTCAMVA